MKMAGSGYIKRPQREEAGSLSTTTGGRKRPRREEEAAGSSSTASGSCRYDVFLSFRGADTRKSFTDHLYTALKQAGFHTFRDDDGIRRGEGIDTEIQNAICSTKLSLIVFSKGYASSRWCLDELSVIMSLRRTFGHLVLPVFHDVDPSEVSEQTGKYGEAFAVHEAHFKEEMEMVNGWRVALKEAADLGGMVLQDRYEAQFIHDIVKEVSKNVKRKPFVFTSPFVGRDFDVDAVNLWLQSGSAGGNVAVLYGVGGVGKTAIAKIVYNQNFDRFEGRSFLSNVRERSEQPNGLVHLQEQLLSDILNKSVDRIGYDVDAGNVKIKDALCCRKVLIVLDDLEKKVELNAVIVMQNWLHPGSKMIITTRNESLLPAYEACVKFRVEPLDGDESLQLFSWYAFGQTHPIEDYMEPSKSIIKYCSGIPLALTVIGSALSGKNVRVWESALQEMASIPNGEILKILKISYDSLDNDHHKNLFLDIACFFTGMNVGYVHKILSGLGIDALFGMQNLIDRCLMKVNGDKNISMHPLIKVMGRKIAHEELPKCSRIWCDSEAFTLLRENDGSKTTRGLTLDMHALSEDGRDRSFLPLDSKAFLKMQNLKYLKLNYVQLGGNYGYFPKKLTWLSWHGFCLNFIPKQLDLENIVVLDMSRSRLVDVWKGKMFLPKLKILDLRYSCWLRRTPDLSGVPCLEKLILKECIRLVELHESIGLLNSLIELDLSGCSNLMEVPLGYEEQNGIRRLLYRAATVGNTVQRITTMTWTLVSSFFSPRESLDLAISSLPHSLVRLELGQTPISHLPESIRNVNTLEWLWLRKCERLRSLSELPKRLRLLNVSHCSSLQDIPLFPPALFLEDCHELVDAKDRIQQEFIQVADLYMLRTINMAYFLEAPFIIQILIKSSSGEWQIFLVAEDLSLLLFEKDEGEWVIQEEGSDITFIIPSLPSSSTNSQQQICGLTIWAVCWFRRCDEFVSQATIINQTKGRSYDSKLIAPFLTETFYTHLQEESDTEVIWVSRWNLENDEIDYGDEVRVYLNLRPNVEIKKIGIKLVYESVSDEDEILSEEKSITSEILTHYHCITRYVIPERLSHWTFVHSPNESV